LLLMRMRMLLELLHRLLPRLLLEEGEAIRMGL